MPEAFVKPKCEMTFQLGLREIFTERSQRKLRKGIKHRN